MEYLKLNNGIKVLILGLSTWKLRKVQCEKAISVALDKGYRMIDKAQMYQNLYF